MKKKIFLLGGYDLEMLTIKSLLEQQDEMFYDKKLRWDNASLSAYSEELKQYGNNPGYEIYGIELIEKESDIPSNYHRIDHHNQLSTQVSSLEQISILLNAKLTREQQLIAMNDRGYIPAMQAFGASDGEIREIRLADRQVQGVTLTDEKLAEKAIAGKTEKGGVIIVRSETNRFSPITDRLYPYGRLLIYTPDELMYYGNGKSGLAGLFREEIKKGKMFHGGGDTGFIGVARSTYSEKEISELIDTIVKHLNL